MLTQLLAHYRDVVHGEMRRAIGKLDEDDFVSLIGRAVEESPADHLLVVQLAYPPEKINHFKDARTGKAFENLLLCLAAASGRCEVIEFLLSNGASLQDTVTLDCIKFYRTRMSPLHYSVKYGHELPTRLLIESGAYVNSQAHEDEKTPLLEAKQLSGSKLTGIVRLMLDHGASVKLKTPLVEIAGNASAETIELLVSHGAKVNQADVSDDSQHPLLRAIRRLNAEATQKLLEKGADVHEIDRNNDKTPLGTVVSCKPYIEKDRKSIRDIVKLLLQYGANINKGTATKSPLALAASSANVPALEVLLERGAEWKDTSSNCPISLQGLIDSHGGLMKDPQGLLLLKRIAKCNSPLDRVRPAMSGLERILIRVFDNLSEIHHVGPVSFAKGKVRESTQVGGLGRFFTTNEEPGSISLQSQDSEFWRRSYQCDEWNPR